jgi:hypothetical protein
VKKFLEVGIFNLLKGFAYNLLSYKNIKYFYIKVYKKKDKNQFNILFSPPFNYSLKSKILSQIILLDFNISIFQNPLYSIIFLKLLSIFSLFHIISKLFSAYFIASLQL